MAVFAYKALEADGRAVTGTVVADTPRQVRDELRARGLTVEDVSGSAVGAVKGERSRAIFGRRHSAHAVTFVRELSTLMGAGIPLVDALSTLAEQATGRFRGVLLSLQDRVAAGAGLAEAMREHPSAFDELAISLTEVGESAGTLDAVLERLADFQERSDAIRGRIGTALIYPAIVLVVTIGVSILLMTFVVPKLLGTLMQADRPVPLPTRIVKAISDALVDWWWVILIALVVVAVGASLTVGTERGRRRWHTVQLRLPILGNLVRKQAVARIAVVISVLLRSGVVFVRSLQIAQRATSNLVIRDALSSCEEAVHAGADIAAALRQTRAFPPMVVQIFAVGQESGRLEDMLDRLALDYDRQATTASQRLTAILEPMLILFMVVVIGFVAFATILPMLQAADAF